MTGRARVAAASALLLAAASGFARPDSVAAQAICSAPHSSPTLTQSGAIRTLPPGAAWLQLSVYGSRSTEGFDPTGARRRFLANARFDVRSLFLTGAVGVHPGVELWLQAPLHDLGIRGDGGRSDASGLGDVRAALRLSPALLDYEFPVALRVGIKLPGSEFPVSATELPISEGQVDYEVSVEGGWSSEDLPVYGVVWAGYRWRTRNDDVGFRPGDERFAHAAIGAMHGRLRWELGLDALWGTAPYEAGLTLPGAARRLVQLLPTIGTDLGPGQLELTTPIPVSGRNLPAGFGVSLGYRALWGL